MKIKLVADMFNFESKSITGYIKIAKDYTIVEISGQVEQILRIKNISVINIQELLILLKKNLKSFFEIEIIPAVYNKQIANFHFERKNSILSATVVTFSDSTSVISFEESKEENKLNKNALSDKLQEVLIRINPDLQVIYLSKNFSVKMKQKDTDKIGFTLEESKLFADKTDIVTTLISKVFKTQKQKNQELQLQKGRKIIWYNLKFVPENDPLSGIQTVLIILKNVNRVKNIQKRLLESEQRYQMATEATDLGIWDYNVIENKTFYSGKWKNMLGYYSDEIPDEFSVWEELLHPDERDRMIRYFDLFLKSDKRIYEVEFRLKHKVGHYLLIRSRGTVLRDENGKAIRMIGTHRDITEERKAVNEFKKLHQAIIQSPISVIVSDYDGFIEFFNPAFCKITGWNDTEILGKKTNILKSGFHPDNYYKKLWETIKSGNEWQGEFKNKKKNGEYYWELASISPIRNEYGTITHFVKISENISYLKKIENDLKKAKQDAELANNYKNNFLANMSHEIRTPINTIIGFSELLKNESISESKKNKYSLIIEENSQALLRLIDDILDVAKIEANELKIKKEACSLYELFSELEITYNDYLIRRQKQKLDLIITIPEESHHDVIFTDPYRLKQIINNLFINSLKYTEIGKIEIGYTIINENKLQFFVSDTGVGISSENIKNIFRRFSQNVDGGLGTFGSGIGLSICKDLAILLGGNINVMSELNKGSSFYITIPYDKIKIPIVKEVVKTKPEKKYDFKDSTIMIAEDAPYNYEYLFSILQKTGANIIWAKDGIDVLKIYNETKIDLILMDIQLPEISGYEAASQIRKSNTQIPIIAQTAYAMANDKQKCLDSGCDEVLVKPIRMDEVLITVAKYLKK